MASSWRCTASALVPPWLGSTMWWLMSRSVPSAIMLMMSRDSAISALVSGLFASSTAGRPESTATVVSLSRNIRRV
jgi:hypothetical protein